MRLCWVCLRVFVSRIWGCRQTGAPQTRCRLGAMLNNPAQTGRGLHHSCFILSTYPPHLSPHPPVPCQYRQQYKLWRDFSGNRKQFTSSLFCVVPPPAASCHGSLLFSQEISQTSPEVDLVHSKMSACQGVLRLLHSFAAQRLSLSLSVSPALHLTPATAPCFSFVLSKMSIWSDTTDVCRYAIGCICWSRNQLILVLYSSFCPLSNLLVLTAVLHGRYHAAFNYHLNMDCYSLTHCHTWPDIVLERNNCSSGWSSPVPGCPMGIRILQLFDLRCWIYLTCFYEPMKKPLDEFERLMRSQSQHLTALLFWKCLCAPSRTTV